jgi:hypothetical protein
MNALGEATITVTTQEGGHSASCTVSTYLGSAERARQAEFDRLSAWPPNEQCDIIEVKEMADFGNVPPQYGWGYGSSAHRVRGFGYAVSPTVTDPTLRAELESEVERYKKYLNTWPHEYHHAWNAPYVEPSSIYENGAYRTADTGRKWIILFLDEATAFQAGQIYLRGCMLEDYARLLEQWVSGGKDPQQFQFSARSWYYDTFGWFPERITEEMGEIWNLYDAKNDFAALASSMPKEEASLLVKIIIDEHSDRIERRVYDFVSVFSAAPPLVPTSFDTEEFYMRVVNRCFTIPANYRNPADGNTFNLFELIGQDGRGATMARLRAEMEKDRERWLHPVAVTGVTCEPTTLNLRVGEYGYTRATLQPADPLNQRVAWSSSDESIASVIPENASLDLRPLAKASGPPR